MTRWWRSLRVRLATLGFLAIYVPVLLVFVVTALTVEEHAENDGRTGTDEADVDVDHSTTTRPSPWVSATVLALGPGSAGAAWWWAGRAVRPLDRVRGVAEDITASDLSRRIGPDRAPTEVAALAASFDAMLDRLEHAASTQEDLIDEASHELRNPLAVLTTNADVVLAQPDATPADYRSSLERSRSAAQRMSAVLDDLLVDARGRARTIDRHPTDLVALARQAADDAHVLARADRVHVVVAGPETLTCRLDAVMVTRALTNLLTNAVTYAASGTAVAVTVAADGAEATVTVTDRGPGIPPEDQARIFQRFWSGDHDEAGTGLGLPIARQIALAHGGDLTVTSPVADDSASGALGSCFRLVLRR